MSDGLKLLLTPTLLILLLLVLKLGVVYRSLEDPGLSDSAGDDAIVRLRAFPDSIISWLSSSPSRSRSEVLSNSLESLDLVEEFEKGEMERNFDFREKAGKLRARVRRDDDSSSVVSISISISSSSSMLDAAVLWVDSGYDGSEEYTGRRPGLGVPNPIDPARDPFADNDGDLDADRSSSLSVS